MRGGYELTASAAGPEQDSSDLNDLHHE